MLEKMLKDLEAGEPLDVAFRQNQLGETIVTNELSFRDGEWISSSLCNSSIDYGLGTCRCNSHPAWYVETISREAALKIIMSVIKNREAESASKQAELNWLKDAIKDVRGVYLEHPRIEIIRNPTNTGGYILNIRYKDGDNQIQNLRFYGRGTAWFPKIEDAEKARAELQDFVKHSWFFAWCCSTGLFPKGFVSWE